MHILRLDSRENTLKNSRVCNGYRVCPPAFFTMIHPTSDVFLIQFFPPADAVLHIVLLNILAKT